MTRSDLGFPKELLQPHPGPCISIYLPTHRRRPENAQDPIRYRNLLKGVEERLQGLNASRELMNRFQALSSDSAFWNQSLEGLAIFGAGDTFMTLRLPHPVPEIAVVGDRFHLPPLIRVFQFNDRYQVLCLSRTQIRLLEGDRDAIEELPLADGVPRTVTEALGEELTEPHRTVASYGKGADGPAMHHGHGGKSEEVDIDAERFFRAVDRAVSERHSQVSNLPLILAALPRHQSVFRGLSKNPFLLEDGIKADPDAFDPDQLREAAFRLIEPYHRRRLGDVLESFRSQLGRGTAAEDPAVIAQAALAGRVSVLMIEADRMLPGRTGGKMGPGGEAGDGDVLDALAQQVLRTGGEVLVLAPAEMPSTAGAAAVFRF